MIDREKAMDILGDYVDESWSREDVGTVIDSILALDAPPVSATRAGGIDRDALHDVLGDLIDEYDAGSEHLDFNGAIDRILALTHPVEAVSLDAVRAELTRSTAPSMATWVDGVMERLAER